LNILLKGLLARSRPYNNDGEHKYYGFQWHDPHNSFPSGHSLVAFTVSTIFAERFNRTYISIPLYSIAALTAISRVRNNQHWFSDVFFGSCLGFWTGLFVVKENTGEKNEASKIMLIPEINRISLIINFN
jgi:membrane-associated phospholipid phosphatase